jgi:hypothetical protein
VEVLKIMQKFNVKFKIIFPLLFVIYLCFGRCTEVLAQSDVFLGKFNSEVDAVDKLSTVATRYWGMGIVYRKELGRVDEGFWREYVSLLNKFVGVCMEIRRILLRENLDLEKLFDLLPVFYGKFLDLERKSKTDQYYSDVSVFFDRNYIEDIMKKENDYRSGLLKVDRRLISGCGAAEDWSKVKIINMRAWE